SARSDLAEAFLGGPGVADHRRVRLSGLRSYGIEWITRAGKAPGTTIGKLHLGTVKALALPDLHAKLADLGLEGIGNSPDEFAALSNPRFRSGRR
ncbi:MAG: hypothetical protein ACXWIS_14840, partial [Burkholderiales bacterium]